MTERSELPPEPPDEPATPGRMRRVRAAVAAATPGEPGRARRAGRRVATAARSVEQSPKFVVAAKLARELMPGDSRYGDPLSTAGSAPPHAAGRAIANATAERPGLLREFGLSALQVWQAVSEAQGRGRGTEDQAILFTDLMGFSNWALTAGDEPALELLRDVGQALEPPMTSHGGRVVKRLGDGLMAVFPSTQPALAAVLSARERLTDVEADGYRPELRVGLHHGRPRRLGGDLLGADVNIAARLAEKAKPNEILVSEAALGELDTGALRTERRRRLKGKGLPEQLVVYAVEPLG